jgi:hypothetical protein
MKRLVVLSLNFFLLLNYGSLFSQTGSQNDKDGIFAAFDRFGNQIPVRNLSIATPHSAGGSTTQAAPVAFCTNVGYFDLYYIQGSYFDGNTAAQNILCEVCNNLTGLIQSPLAAPGNTVRINLLCGTTTLTAESASSYYLIPPFPANPYQGVAEGLTNKGIISGVDPYLNFPGNIFFNGTGFFHGYVNANPSYAWNLSLSTPTISTD